MANRNIPLPVEKGCSLTCRNIPLRLEVHGLAQAGVPKGRFIQEGLSIRLRHEAIAWWSKREFRDRTLDLGRRKTTPSTAAGLLLVSRPERAVARSLARSHSASFAVSIPGFNLPPAMTIACAIVLQVKEYFYRLGNNSTGLGEKQTLSNE